MDELPSLVIERSFKDSIRQAFCERRFSLLDLTLVYAGLTVIGAVGVVLIGVFT